MASLALLVAVGMQVACATTTAKRGQPAFLPCLHFNTGKGSHAFVQRNAGEREPAKRWTAQASDDAIFAARVMARTWSDDVQSGQRYSRQHLSYSLLGAALTCAIKPKAANAMTMRTLKRALVNIVRVREASVLLQTRLEDNLLDSFQDSVKLLVADTQLKENVNLACQGLSELQVDVPLRMAEEKGDRIVQVCYV